MLNYNYTYKCTNLLKSVIELYVYTNINTPIIVSTICYKNGAKSDRLYPSAPLEKDDLEQRLEKKIE